jgi:Methyltransferase domain
LVGFSASKPQRQNAFLQRLSLKLRKKLPSRIRHLLRLGRHVVVKGQSSPQIPPDLLADCRVCASRVDLLGFLPHHGNIAEVGTGRGGFARIILDVCAPSELHIIDLDFSQFDHTLGEVSRVVIHDGQSHEKLETFSDNYFDWIYIDADHSYAGVTRDANAAADKVKPGGYLVFNDFAHMDPYLGAYGVHRAVVDFAVARGWKFAWFAYEPSALYDVALRRPSN